MTGHPGAMEQIPSPVREQRFRALFRELHGVDPPPEVTAAHLEREWIFAVDDPHETLRRRRLEKQRIQVLRSLDGTELRGLDGFVGGLAVASGVGLGAALSVLSFRGAGELGEWMARRFEFDSATVEGLFHATWLPLVHVGPPVWFRANRRLARVLLSRDAAYGRARELPGLTTLRTPIRSSAALYLGASTLFTAIGLGLIVALGEIGRSHERAKALAWTSGEPGGQPPVEESWWTELPLFLVVLWFGYLAAHGRPRWVGSSDRRLSA